MTTVGAVGHINAVSMRAAQTPSHHTRSAAAYLSPTLIYYTLGVNSVL